MKRISILLVSFLSFGFSYSQCTVDYSYVPLGANYGLNPDSLPNAYIGQFYDQDMTFFLPLDTVQSGVTVTFTDFHITSISLPLGLTWECNNSSNNCHYDPTSTQYGCVKISGNALVPGYYDVEVNLVATHSLSALVGTENISFTLPLEVMPDTSSSSNAGFSMTNGSGCYPVTVNFTNNNSGMLSYYWNFGNGSSSTMAQPSAQIYNFPGEYVVEYTAVQTNASYFLESIEVISGNCADGGLYGDPDFFYTVTTPAGILEEVTSGNYITQNFPLTINNFPPLLLNGQSVSISLYDNDDIPFFPSTEDCGSFSFVPMQQAGTFSVNGGGLSINYTIMEVPAVILSSTDTVKVYDYPNTPSVYYDTLNSSLHTDMDSIAMQWYYYTSPIPASTDTVMFANNSGIYSLLVVNENGCTASSSDVLVVICDSLYAPTLDENGATAWMIDSALYSNLQWFNSSGSLVGSNQSFFPATLPDYYYVVATDEFGCTYSSDMVFLSPVSSFENGSFDDSFIIYPNPFKNDDRIIIDLMSSKYEKNEAVSLILHDIFGRVIFDRSFLFIDFPFEINTVISNQLENGIYFVNLYVDGQIITRKILKQ